MSTEYSTYICVGYCYSEEEFDHMLIEKPEESHTEKRYNKKTGKEMLPEKVIDKEKREVWVYKGTEYESIEDLIEQIAEDCKCGHTIYGEEPRAVGFFTPREDSDETDNPAGESYPLSVGKNVKISYVIGCKKELEKLKEKLNKILPTRDAEIFESHLVY